MAVVRSCSLLCALVLATGTAFADPPLQKPKQAAALEHLERASKLYNVRSFEDAANEYKAGALIEPAAIFDYNLAQCYRQLHRYPEAIWHYQRFIKQSPQTPEHVEAAQKFITEMQAELDQKAMTEPPNDSGDAPAQSKPAQQPATPVVAPAQQPQIVETEAWYDDPFGWGLAGAGVIGLGVSAALFFDASSLNDDANHASSQMETNALHDRANTRSLLGTVIGIGGAGLLVTGVIKLAIHPASRTSTTTALNVGVSPQGFYVLGSF